MPGEKNYGLNIVITEKGLAILTEAGLSVEDLGKKGEEAARKLNLFTIAGRAVGEPTRAIGGSAKEAFDKLSELGERVKNLPREFDQLRAATGSTQVSLNVMSAEILSTHKAALALGLDVPKSFGKIAEQAAQVSPAAQSASAALGLMGPVIKTSADVGVNALKSVSAALRDAKGNTADLSATLGSVSAGFGSVGWKAAEEGIESLGHKMTSAAASGGGLRGTVGALTGGLGGLAASATGVVAVFGFTISKLVELTKATVEYRETARSVEDAERAAIIGTAKHEEQLERLARALRKPIEELHKFKSGDAAEGFQSIVDHAAKNPESAIAKALDAMAKKAGAARAEILALGPAGKEVRSTMDGLALGMKTVGADFNYAMKVTGSYRGALALMGPDIEGFIALHERMGKKVPIDLQMVSTEWEKLKKTIADESAVRDGVKSIMDGFDDLKRKASALPEIFKQILDKTGSLKQASLAVRPGVESMIEGYKRAGMEVPQWLDAMERKTRLFGRTTEEVTRAAAAGYDRVAEAAARVGKGKGGPLSNDPSLGDIGKFGNMGANRAGSVSVGLGLDGGPTIDANDPRTKALAAQAARAGNQIGGYFHQFVAEAAAALQRGDVGAVSKITAGAQASVSSLQGMGMLRGSGVEAAEKALIVLQGIDQQGRQLLANMEKAAATAAREGAKAALQENRADEERRHRETIQTLAAGNQRGFTSGTGSIDDVASGSNDWNARNGKNRRAW